MNESNEPSYYEIALTNRQVVVAFVLILSSVMAAFLSGVWVGSQGSLAGDDRKAANKAKVGSNSSSRENLTPVTNEKAKRPSFGKANLPPKPKPPSATSKPAKPATPASSTTSAMSKVTSALSSRFSKMSEKEKPPPAAPPVVEEEKVASPRNSLPVLERSGDSIDDFDLVERSERLAHPTAGRARAPKRRPPSSVFNKDAVSHPNYCLCMFSRFVSYDFFSFVIVVFLYFLRLLCSRVCTVFFVAYLSEV